MYVGHTPEKLCEMNYVHTYVNLQPLLLKEVTDTMTDCEDNYIWFVSQYFSALIIYSLAVMCWGNVPKICIFNKWKETWPSSRLFYSPDYVIIDDAFYHYKAKDHFRQWHTSVFIASLL